MKRFVLGKIENEIYNNNKIRYHFYFSFVKEKERQRERVYKTGQKQASPHSHCVLQWTDVWKRKKISQREKSIRSSLSIINRRQTSISRIISWWRCWSRCIIICIGLFNKSCVHHLSNMIHFSDIWASLRIDDKTSGHKMTKLKEQIQVVDQANSTTYFMGKRIGW